MKRYMTMRYPAAWHGEMWREGAPCGNGTVGALVYGSVAREIVMLNHAQLWRNGKIQEIPDISYTLPQIRGFIENHKPELANNILSDALHEKGYNACTSELFPLGDIKTVADVIERGGFILMSSKPKRVSFNKGYTIDGFADKVYHIHLRYLGDNNELYFRDYLNEYPEVAKEYEKLKLTLWEKFEHDRDAYTNAKTDFVQHWTKEARKNMETDIDKSDSISYLQKQGKRLKNEQ